MKFVEERENKGVWQTAWAICITTHSASETFPIRKGILNGCDVGGTLNIIHKVSSNISVQILWALEIKKIRKLCDAVILWWIKE